MSTNDASMMITASKPDELGRFMNAASGATTHGPIDLVITDVTPGVAAIATERARVMEDRGFTPEHDAEHHTAEKLLFWAGLFNLAARRMSNISLGREDFYVVPWDVPFDKPMSYYVTISGQLTAAALDLLIDEEN